MLPNPQIRVVPEQTIKDVRGIADDARRWRQKPLAYTLVLWWRVAYGFDAGTVGTKRASH